MASWFDDQKGETALIIGGGEGLARRIRSRFRHVVAADPSRSLDAAPRAKAFKEGEVLFVQGRDAQPDQLPNSCDLIVLAFHIAQQDDPPTFLQKWVSLLSHQGKLVLLEWSPARDRFSKNQHLHRELLETLEAQKRMRRSVSRDLVKWMQVVGLVHVRQLTEPTPSFFSEADTRLLAAEGLSELMATGLGKGNLAERLREKRQVECGPVLIVHGIHKTRPDLSQGEELADPEESSDRKVTDKAVNPVRKEHDTPLSSLLAGVLEGYVSEPHEKAKLLLNMYGSKALTQIRDASLLAKDGKLPIEEAERLIRMFALSHRLFVDSTDLEIHGPEDAYQYLAPEMAHLTREHFRGLYLNVKGGLVVDEVISIGTLTSSLVHPREVFGPAIEKHCHSLLIAHNHPSGDPTPSLEDIQLTRELAEAGRLLNIELLDHIVIGRDSYVSLKEKRHF